MIRKLMLALAMLLLAPAAAAQDLAQDTARVVDLRSIREIRNLQAWWGHQAMRGEWREMALYLTDDAVMAFQQRELHGRAEIQADLRATQGGGADGMTAGRLNIRLWISPVITLSADGQSATARWHEVALTGVAGQSADWAGNTWVVRYVRQNGQWLIAHMRAYAQFAGPYATGWSHDAATLERAPYHYTPEQAGMLLPQRVATQPFTREQIDREANLLLEQGRVRNVASAFGYYLDRGMVDDVADLFAKDGRVLVQGQGEWQGQAGVRRFLAQFGAPGLDQGELNDHPQLMPIARVTRDGGRAAVTTVELGMTGQHGGDGFWSAALNRFTLARGTDGVWRIVSLYRIPIMRSSYAAGWANPLDGVLPIPAGMEPDLAPIAAPMTYPQAHISWPTGGMSTFSGQFDPTYDSWDTDNALAIAEAFDGAENVSNAYGYYIDQFSWANTSALFARDGWKELSYIGTFIGRSRVELSMVQRYGNGGPNDAFQAIHQLTQPYVTASPDGQRAQIRSRLLQMNSSSTGPGSWIGGIYENQVVKEDGIWRIHGMDLDYVWLADYLGGWMAADPASSARFGLSAEAVAAFAPDAPLRGEAFAPFPRIAPMGFHFANPVSGREPDLRLHWSDGHRE